MTPATRGGQTPGKGSRRAFGATWWGATWVDALEKRAQLDPNRLPRGRTYARSGRVGDLEVDRGQVRAQVQGRQARPYSVVVRVRPFSDAEWDRVLRAIAARAAHAAALLDGELAPGVLEDCAEAGIGLLPGAGEVGPRCSCPDWADPCKHSAAVCYLVAGVLDEDPFALLLLRGRSRDEVLAGIRQRRGPAAATQPRPASEEADPGVEARAAYGQRPAGPIPAPPPLPARPGTPAVLATDPPAGSGLRRQDLVELAADAARRAFELSTGDGDGGLGLSVTADLARRAACRLDEGDLLDLPERSGLTARELVRQGVAWGAGGTAGLAVLGDPWPIDAEAADEATAALAALGPVRVTGNRVTAGSLQLRFGPDERWYPFQKRSGRWEPAGSAEADPARIVGRDL
ncbi:MAG: SWIM zinc finger family protein [Actinomycetota bacterium]